MSAEKLSLQEARMAVRINSFREIASRYDVVLCDVWGVLHNGVQAFASACEALAEARAQGVTVVLITNSPRPHPSVKVQIRGLGVPDEAYDRIVTSGDVTRALIASAAKRIFFIGADRDLPLLEGLGTRPKPPNTTASRWLASPDARYHSSVPTPILSWNAAIG
jgi:ribonucleotide monophosphatase NagD (HAD superfamily)